MRAIVLFVWLITPAEPGMPKAVMRAFEVRVRTPVELLKVQVWPAEFLV